MDKSSELSHVVLLAELVATQRAISASNLDVEAVMREVATQTRRLTGADAAVIEMLERDEIVYRAVAGTAEPHLGVRLEAATSLSGHAIRTGEIVLCDDAASDPRVNRHAALKVGARSMLIVPISEPDAGAGVLKVYSELPGAFGERELRVLQMMVAALGTALARAKLADDLADSATTDELTRLPNRKAWLERGPRELARAARSGKPLCLAVLEVDEIDSYDAEHGRADGDRLVAEIAARWSRAVRSVDLLARVGRAEFVLVLPDCPPENALDVLARLRRGSREVREATAGVAGWDGSETAEALLDRARTALLCARGSGGVAFAGDDVEFASHEAESQGDSPSFIISPGTATA